MKKETNKNNTTDIPTNNDKLFLALELSKKTWVLCFGNGKKVRHRSVAGGDARAVLKEIELCKEKFNMPSDTPVFSCYEAGRDGFWLHRFLVEHKIQNHVFDSASIEVNRRSKHTKTDRVDAKKLLSLLIRLILMNETKVCSVVKVPTRDEEDQMRVDRERGRLVKERTGHKARIRSLLKLHGIEVKGLSKLNVGHLVDYQGDALPDHLVVELEREQVRMKLVEEQLKQVEFFQNEQVSNESSQSEMAAKAAQLMRFKGIGIQTAWILCCEFFWRDFNNRREVGASAGLTGCAYDSGDSRREQGISKAGNPRVRTCCIEMAWNWVRFQPQSELTKWFFKRFDRNGNSRSRRVGIVALARKLLIAMWKFLESGELPAKAIFAEAC